MAVFLKDLTFIEDGNKNFRSDNTVNFEKMTMLAAVFSKIHHYQQHPFAFEPDPDIQAVLRDLYIVKGDRELYKFSSECEGGAGHSLGLHKSATETSVPIVLNPKKPETQPTTAATSATSKVTTSSPSVDPKTSNNKTSPVVTQKPITSSPTVAPKSTESPKSQPTTKAISKVDTKKEEDKERKKKEEEERKKRDEEAKRKAKQEAADKKKAQKSPTEVVIAAGPKRSIKIVVVGDGMTGKTCLLVRYTTKAFPQGEYVPTIFDNYNAIESCGGQQVNLILWDTAGQEDLAKMRTLNYKDTDCVIICYSVDNRTSFLNIRDKWVPEVSNFCRDAAWVIVGLKCDLYEDKRLVAELQKAKEPMVTAKEGEQLARKVGAVFHMQCSALKGIHVQDIFVKAMEKTLELKAKHKKKKR
jgi:small GTP-binding protein